MDNGEYLGIGAMLRMMGGDTESAKAFVDAQNKTITAITIDKRGDQAVNIEFADGSHLWLADDARSCCECRYLSANEDGFAAAVGAVFLDIHIERPVSLDETLRAEVEETQRFKIHTSKGDFPIIAHNEHNGYYGGIHISCRTKYSEDT